MSLTDTFAGFVSMQTYGTLSRAMGTGGHTGTDTLNHEYKLTLTDGTGANQATAWFSTLITVTTASNTISLANADPTGSLGDDTPSATIEGLKLRAIIIENKDTTNYITLGLGSNKITNWIGGTSPTIRITAGGCFMQTFPSGIDALNDSSDDEITLQANSASVSVKLTCIFG